MDKRITLTPAIIRDLKIVAAETGTNSKTYIENLVAQHLIDIGFPREKGQKVVRVNFGGESFLLKGKAKKK